MRATENRFIPTLPKRSEILNLIANAWGLSITSIQSIYGGMGNWNDFYLLALEEAEKQRMSLGIGICNLAKEMKTQIITGPNEPKRSLWEKLKEQVSWAFF